jgi:hypothetical protein
VGLELKVAQAQARQRQAAVGRLIARRRSGERLGALLGKAAAEMKGVEPERFDLALAKLIGKHPELECAFVLDRLGNQVSATVETAMAASRARPRLFQPARRGADHSLKDYFYGLMDGGLTRFITEPYISLASGKLCRTLACPIQSPEGGVYFLCLDMAEA